MAKAGEHLQVLGVTQYVFRTIDGYDGDRLARNAEDLLRTTPEVTGLGVTVEFVKNHLTFRGNADPTAKMPSANSTAT